MAVTSDKLLKLRNVINENLRTQVHTDDIKYVSSGHVLSDASSKQSHCVFARRGCGKTLLLHQSRKGLPSGLRAIYINCEDFKHHSFPNVLIFILDKIFAELEKNLTSWFGKKRKLRTIVQELREDLQSLAQAADTQEYEVREARQESAQYGQTMGAEVSVKGDAEAGAKLAAERIFKGTTDVELKYRHNENKLRELNQRLPRYKEKIGEFFGLSPEVQAVFVQIDDFYHLTRADQPFVADYIHRLCKDTQLKFKIATLRHNSVLYIERNRQPIGIQERHDYQPINIDFTLEQFDKTRELNRAIFYEFGETAGLGREEIDSLFKGQGFDRLVIAGGGVPRDCLSFFLEVLETVRRDDPEGRIGKDDVRVLSRQTFESRINELKQDSEGQDQESLLRAIYAIRKFCLTKKSNVFLVAESDIQKDDVLKTLLYRLLDYRIIHQVARSLSHKSIPGPSFQGFAIDMGCYAFMRNLQGKLVEVDLAQPTAREQMRSAPVLSSEEFTSGFTEPAGSEIGQALATQESEEDTSEPTEPA